MNDFGLLVGRYLSSLPTLTDTQLAELLLDAKGRLIISGRYLEDDGHASGDAGIFALGIRNDNAGVDGVFASVVYDTVTFTADNMGVAGNSIALVFNGSDDVTTVVGAWNTANPTNTVSFSGQPGTYVPAAGTATLTGGVDDTSLTSANKDYSGFAVDKYGRIQTVTDLDVTFDYVYAEDAPAANGDLGAYVLAVRQDTLATSTSNDGDFASFKVNAKGELYVKDTDTLSKLGDIDTSLNNIETDVDTIATDVGLIKTEIQNLSFAEDSTHNSGDAGIMALAVRHDADSALAGDGDYASLQVNSVGRLKTETTITLPGTEQYTVTDALAAAGDGLETITASATPWITVASYALSTGTGYIFGWQWACDQNADARLITDDSSNIIVYKRALNSSAEPSYSEHFATDGRIEIAGATNLVIKLQIKKRSATGGNANGTGSFHLRTI